MIITTVVTTMWTKMKLQKVDYCCDYNLDEETALFSMNEYKSNKVKLLMNNKLKW